MQQVIAAASPPPGSWISTTPTTSARQSRWTLAGGMYGSLAAPGEAYRVITRQLLRAAYLGTLLGAIALGRRVVVLTLIGGGVFGNPIELIWESILWAMEEATRVAPVAWSWCGRGRVLNLDVGETACTASPPWLVVRGHLPTLSSGSFKGHRRRNAPSARSSPPTR